MGLLGEISNGSNKYSLLRPYRRSPKDWKITISTNDLPYPMAFMNNGKRRLFMLQLINRRLYATNGVDTYRSVDVVFKGENHLPDDKLYHLFKSRLLDFLKAFCEEEGGLVRGFGLSGPDPDEREARDFIEYCVSYIKTRLNLSRG